MFSPYYFRARRQGAADPENFCALNAILYSPRGKHWALTERGAGDLDRDALRMTVGPSELRYEDGALVVDIREVTVPWPRRMLGRVRIALPRIQPRSFDLDPAGRHHWWPVAPRAEVEVEFERPSRCWRGEGYFDANWGEEPLEEGFSYWHWSRTQRPGHTTVSYEAWPRHGDPQLLSLGFTECGGVEQLPAGPSHRLPPSTVWRTRRDARADQPPAVEKTFEDTPFYTRSLLREADGCATLHESLDLDRFRKHWVQTLLPFRMPRRPLRR